MRYVNGTRLDDRIVRVDWDAGFIEGRQYGRGKSGGQVRDGKLFSYLLDLPKPNCFYLPEYRTDFDGGRGGYGHSIKVQAVKNVVSL